MGGRIVNPRGRSSVLLVCEHATNAMPAVYNGLGLQPEALKSHIAWDPGAVAVARELSSLMDAVLIEGTVSRLVYDCNRPPDSPTAIPQMSEIYDIPGNRNLSPDMRKMRVDAVYLPFRRAVGIEAERKNLLALVTIHSFTPIFHGHRREVEIGVLDDGEDTRLATSLLAEWVDSPYCVQSNRPYGPADGVAHTLNDQGTRRGLLNVMLEIRSDLIANERDQGQMAAFLAPALATAIGRYR